MERANDCVVFGEFVRARRTANKITGREAAQAAEMLPSNFSKLEHGALAPPRDPTKQALIAEAIGLREQEQAEFFDLAAKANEAVPVDIADIISHNDALPLLLRTIGNKRLSQKQIDRLVEIIRGKK